MEEKDIFMVALLRVLGFFLLMLKNAEYENKFKITNIFIT